MNIDEYKQKFNLYEHFAKTIKDILISAISRSNSEGGYHFHLQQIQSRAKTCDSLIQRLSEHNLTDCQNIEEIRHDLAGCRVIFYYNDDVNAFLSSGLIRQNFDIARDHIKVHGPIGMASSANEYYTANHYIVQLDEKRAALPEYAQFKGLKCEIQIHTVLNHAWSETAHNITYKKPTMIENYGSHTLESIDRRLKHIMDTYLKPAGYEFQKIQHDYKRLLEGKKILDRNIEKEIESCKDNNERHELLERYYKYTLPNFDENYFKNECSTILRIVKTAFSLSKASDTIDISTPLGIFPGKSPRDILDVCSNILNFIHYVDVYAVFDCIINLFRSSDNDAERDIIKGSIKTIVRYNINVLEQAGFYVQNVIMDYLLNLSDIKKSELVEIIIDICGYLFDPIAESTSSDYKSLTISQASIPANLNAEKLRQSALDLLTSSYNPKAPESLKQRFITVFDAASRTPLHCDYSDALFAIILKNCITTIDFYTTIINIESFEILENIEHRVCLLYKRANDIVNSNRIEDKECLERCKVILEKSIVFRDSLNKNRDYVIYKTLVGYKSVFKNSWSNDAWGVQKTYEYRENKIKTYINTFENHESDYWKKMILRCAKTQSNDGATFRIFGMFLKLLSSTKPDFMLNLLKKHEDALMNFSCPILDGLLSSNSPNDTLAQMGEWVRQEKHLYECARVFEFYTPLNARLLNEILKSAINISDTAALSSVMAVVAYNFNLHHPNR